MGSRVVIIGGHGKIAMLATPLLTAAGHSVTSVVRNPDHISDVEAEGATGVVCDVENSSADDIAELIGDHDVVVWSAGAGGGDPQRTYAVDRDAAIHTIDAAEQSSASRFIMVSYIGAGIDNVPEDNSFYPYATAKAAADNHLRQSSLDWTVLGPSMLTNDGPSGQIEITENGSSVSRADVAAVIVEAIAQSLTVGKTVRFNSGSTPISEALASL